jgi:hypothetical protein
MHPKFAISAYKTKMQNYAGKKPFPRFYKMLPNSWHKIQLFQTPITIFTMTYRVPVLLKGFITVLYANFNEYAYLFANIYQSHLDSHQYQSITA